MLAVVTRVKTSEMKHRRRLHGSLLVPVVLARAITVPRASRRRVYDRRAVLAYQRPLLCYCGNGPAVTCFPS